MRSEGVLVQIDEVAFRRSLLEVGKVDASSPVFLPLLLHHFLLRILGAAAASSASFLFSGREDILHCSRRPAVAARGAGGGDMFLKSWNTWEGRGRDVLGSRYTKVETEVHGHLWLSMPHTRTIVEVAFKRFH